MSTTHRTAPNTAPITRRSFLSATLGTCALLAGCGRSSSSKTTNTERTNVTTTPAPSLHPKPSNARPKDLTSKPTQGEARWESVQFSKTPVGREEALLLTPWNLEENPPVLVALHGRSETRSVHAGARGWRDDYELTRAHNDLVSGTPTAQTFRGLIQPERLSAIQRSLTLQPYRGIKLACPYTPDLMARHIDPSARGVEPFGRFLKEQLIPHTAGLSSGVLPKRTRVAIDGISLGGRVALLVGLSFPEVFGAVGGMQPAFQTSEVPYLTKLVLKARRDHPPQLIRLVTSKKDPFRRFVLAFSKSLGRANIDHDVLVTPGPHDYIWNQGPGSAEMLLWYDRILRGGFGVGGNVRSMTEL